MSNTNNKLKNFAFTKRNRKLLEKKEQIKSPFLKEKEKKIKTKEEKKYGRPKKPVSERKRQVGVGLTTKETEKLEKERLKAGFPSLPSYIRNLLIKNNII